MNNYYEIIFINEIEHSVVIENNGDWFYYTNSCWYKQIFPLETTTNTYKLVKTNVKYLKLQGLPTKITSYTDLKDNTTKRLTL